MSLLRFSIITSLLLAVAMTSHLGCKSTQPVAQVPDNPGGSAEPVPVDDVPASWGAPPHASETREATTEPANLTPWAVSCTEMACGEDNPCCNSCGSDGWGANGKQVASGTTPFPTCQLDGCGNCSYSLSAVVDETAETWTASSWAKRANP